MVRERLLLPALALALGFVSLGVVGPVAPASAQPQPCTVTYLGDGFTVNKVDAGKSVAVNNNSLEVADPRHVTDVDFHVDIDVKDAAKTGVFIYRGSGANAVHGFNAYNYATGVLQGGYTFDDEAMTSVINGHDPAPGRYLPYSPFAPLEGASAAGTWSIWINNLSTEHLANLHSWSITLTYATCDTDGDGIEDHVDNCPLDANATQANLDGDALGDACDPDIDNDGVPNTADPCPTVAGLPTTGCPAPPTEPEVTEPEVTEVGRTAKLVKKARKRRLIATVTSSHPACQNKTRALLMRVKKKGKDVRVAKFTTNRKGKKTLRLPKRKGRYYVQLPARTVGTVVCEATTSRKIRR